MTAARDAILEAVRDALEQSTRDTETIATEARMLLDDLDEVRPVLPLPDWVASFTNRVEGPKVGATVERIAEISDLPAAIARRLMEAGHEAKVTLQPTRVLKELDWPAAGVRLGDDVDDAVVVGLALWGIAETGSLVFHSSPETPILHNFLCATHIVAVHSSTIVPYLEDYAAAARKRGDPAPRNACLITGASGTTDIEGSLVKGAHGPRELHVIVIDDNGV